MALLTYRAPVNYEEQQGNQHFPPPSHTTATNSIAAAFGDFLANFKASTSSAEAADALQDLTIDEDGLSDEYDFMDDAQDGGPARRREQQRGSRDPKRKYMEMLQRVANRQQSQVLIDLDDLDTVRLARLSCIRALLTLGSTVGEGTWRRR